jgi:hypothetical protein
MTLTWENTGAFKQHMEEMESFRRAHPDLAPVEQLKLVRAASSTGNSTCRGNQPASFTDSRGKAIVVPIWDMTMPKGSEN